MSKKTLFILTLGLLSKGLWAAPITAEQAAQKAKQFMMAKKGQVKLEQTTWQKDAASRGYTDATDPLLYVFNVGQNEGFVIVSGEDLTPEVLAYTEQGSYDYDQLPENTKVWIDSYARQIEALRQDNVETSTEEVEVHESIAPLLTSHWNQDAPYNNSCPVFVNGARSVTGCVATAMAQVLYHHRAKSVQTLQATIPAYLCSTLWTGAGHVSVGSFDTGSVINWANMLDNYTGSATESQKKAVADLMAYCGASVETDYRDAVNGGSSASEIGIPEALKKYFGYNVAATLKYRDRFSADNWDKLIYYELLNGRPVIISGQDTGGKGGHAFVCDGYDNGYYHLNWGWGGLSDGYYLITDLRPDNQGAGGNGSAYNKDVTAIIGMEPGDGTPYEEQMRLTMVSFSKPTTQTIVCSSKAELVDFEYEYVFQNRTTSTRTFDFALALYQDGQFKDFLTSSRNGEFSKNGTYTPGGKLSKSFSLWQNYGIGTYQVKVVSRLTGTDEWGECIDADKWYVDMVIGEDRMSYTLHQYDEPTPSGINAPEVGTQHFTGPMDVYTLTGVKVASGATTLQGLPAGLYIVQGRKVVVR